MIEIAACPECGTHLAPTMLACPVCHRLLHKDRLADLAQRAEQAEYAGNLSAALAAWNEAAGLLPPDTRQAQAITARIQLLGRRLDGSEARPQRTPGRDESPNPNDHTEIDWGKAGAAGVGGIALFFWKFKFALVPLLGKGKILLLGLTKLSTFLSMFVTFQLYWARYGWKFAAGLIGSIYVHEMGHVYRLRRYGIQADAPVFIPFVGAFVRLQQEIFDVRQDARVGLGGPIWGLGAALAFCAGAWAFDSPACAAIARLGAWINLFNLIPIWNLDGGRAFRALTRSQRWLATAAIGFAWAVTEEPMLILLLLGAVFRTLTDRGPTEPDREALGEYIGLIAAFSILMMIPLGR